ncbi:sensor histidine kinase [Nocardia terpenica]|nr:histidine kinase [Nocardia terpenica]
MAVTITPPTRLSRLLRLVGLVSVVSAVISTGLPGQRWELALIAVSWVGWALFIVAPVRPRWPIRVSLSLMAICGGLTVAYSASSAITALATVFVAISLADDSPVVGLAIAAAALLSSCASLTVAQERPRMLLNLLVGTAVIGLMGWSRRQARISAEQNRLLLQQNRVIRAERDRAAALAERGRIARDIHDVLAHTLGGLVMQLDAADALLEAGEVDRAADRVRASHRLAISGLEDARRVVGALRSEGIDLAAELLRLADEHRGAGGQVEVRTDTELRGIDAQAAVAITRAVQESLTNARKHAPGQPVSLSLRDEGDRLAVDITNPLAAQRGSLTGSGSGAGLLGMGERLAASGGTVEARKEDGRWTVRIRVPRFRAATP